MKVAPNIFENQIITVGQVKEKLEIKKRLPDEFCFGSLISFLRHKNFRTQAVEK